MNRKLMGAGAVAAIALVPVLLSCGKKSSSPMQPACAPSVAQLDFGAVVLGQSKDLSFTITNSSGGTLAGTVVSPCAEFALQGGASYSLGSGASATITVRFTPSQSGTRTCTLDLGGSCSDVSLTGVGSATVCQLSATSLSFGSVTVGESADRGVILTNIGSGTLSGTASISDPAFTIQGSASYSLGPGARDTITVRFAPTAGGVASATLETGSSECSDVSLSGSAVEMSSGNLGPGAVYQHTFSTAGNYPYHCEIHPGMRATVVVDVSGPANASVSIVNSTATGFSPLSVTVAPGGTVTWTNNDNVAHTVTSD